MKNILIIGCARAGKTTLSRMLKEKYPTMNLLVMDSIKNAILRNIDNDGEDNVEFATKYEFSSFHMNMIAECYNSHIRTDKNNFGYILEGAQLLPEIIDKKIDKDNVVIVCLGLGDISSEEIFKNVRKFDNEDDWTYDVADYNLKIWCKHWVELNDKLKEQCPLYGIKYFDTTGNRKEKLNEVMHYIENNL